MRIIVLLGIAGMLVLGGVGCAPTRTQMDFGTPYQLAKFNQTMNPQAEKNLKPVTGLDSQAAYNAVEKYRKDFEKPVMTTDLYRLFISTKNFKN